ncbi:MAG: DUF167 domain-containing protein [Anaerolineales bacterium]|nr:DUF167 domain-containing protein [Anaerolineales bacterium]
MTTFKDARTGAAITVKVTPKAKKTGVAGVLEDGTLKIQVTAPAEDGKANAALVAFLAETLGLKPSQVEIVAGLSSERKLISLIGVTPADVDAKLVPAKKAPRAKKTPAKRGDER